MILVIDVGNTHTVLGIYQHDTLSHHWRLTTDAGRTSDEYSVLLEQRLCGFRRCVRVD